MEPISISMNSETIQLIYRAAYVISRELRHEIKGIKTGNKRWPWMENLLRIQRGKGIGMFWVHTWSSRTKRENCISGMTFILANINKIYNLEQICINFAGILTPTTIKVNIFVFQSSRNFAFLKSIVGLSIRLVP